MILQIIITTFFVPKSQEFSRSLIRTSNIDFLDSFYKTKKI